MTDGDNAIERQSVMRGDARQKIGGGSHIKKHIRVVAAIAGAAVFDILNSEAIACQRARQPPKRLQVVHGAVAASVN